LFYLTACHTDKVIEEHAFMMGTMVSVSIAEDISESKIHTAIAASMHEIQRVEGVFSPHQNNSVQAFNQAKVNTWLILDDEVSDILELSLHIMQQSDSAFQPMLGQLKQLWGFDTDNTAVPKKKDIHHLIQRLAQGKLTQKAKYWKRSHEALQLDFGAIAKGYAIDQAVKVLRQHGINNAIVNAGGDIRLIGKRFNRAWRIGIKHPRHTAQVLGWIELEGDVSLVTSGDYERFFQQSEKKYHHILDVKTGFPATQSQSVTVMAKNATLADAWSTALFVLGSHKLQSISLPSQLEYLIVDQEGKRHLSQGMQQVFHTQ